MFNILANNIVISLLGLVIPLFIYILVFVLIALCIKRKSIIFGISFTLFISSIMLFLESFDSSKLLVNVSKFYEEYGVGASLVSTINMLAKPVEVFHKSFIEICISLKFNEDVINFLKNEIFIVLIYFFFFIITFTISSKRKKEKKSYSDYDS